MKHQLALTVVITLSFFFFGQGCKPILTNDQGTMTNDQPTNQSQGSLPNPDDKVDSKPTAETPNTTDVGRATSDVGRIAIYEDFTQAKYDAAIAAGEPIYLFFFANWCPTCRDQEPVNEQVFSSYPKFFHAFRVHVLDNKVSTDEDNLAKQFKVTRQHTMILIDSNGTEVARTIGTRSAAQLQNDLTKITN